MSYTPTPLLSLPIIATGTESGVWGSDVNNGLTSYLDIAIAGTLNFSSGTSATIANTAGTSSVTNIGSTTAQYAALSFGPSLSGNFTLTAPSSSKTYYIINLDSTYSVTIKASGQSGFTVPAGQRAIVIYNGTDYVKADNYFNNISVSGGAITNATLDATPIGNTSQANASVLNLTTAGTVTFTGTGAVTLPVGTTAQEPGTPSTGMIRFNTSLTQFEGYNGTIWGGIGGANASGCIYVNNQTILSSYVFAANTSGSSTGPITISSGQSVTVGPTSRWVIL